MLKTLWNFLRIVCFRIITEPIFSLRFPILLRHLYIIKGNKICRKSKANKIMRTMLNFIRTSPKWVFLLTLVILMSAGGGCKSKKKAMEAEAAANKAKMEQEAALKKQQEAEELRRKEAEENERREAEARAKAAKTEPYSKLEQYFNAIGGASSVASANSSINEALALFSSGETPVLIVISESGGQKDYDRPTTIKDYLNYLKDQKKRADKIGNLQFDSSGKITEVELIKRK